MEKPEESFEALYSLYAALFQEWLAEYLEALPANFGGVETPLQSAVSYSLAAPGKRLRPVIALAIADSLCVETAKLRSFCLALEVLHTATLIHDDMPAMDDDSLRRGQATCHIKFGEALALLAGDALLTESLRLILEEELLDTQVRLELSQKAVRTIIALCQGQTIDMGFDPLSGNNSKEMSPAQLLELRHRLKTGALISLAVVGPAMLGAVDRSSNALAILESYGDRVGLLFQITDDILDVTQSSQELGKDASSDKDSGRTTFASLYGLEIAQEKAEELAAEAVELARALPTRNVFLLDLPARLLSRTR